MRSTQNLSLAHSFPLLYQPVRSRNIFRSGYLQCSLRRMIALALAALLIPMSCGELLAPQQAPPPKFGNAQQDYSGQIQSDGYGYPGQPYSAAEPQQGDAAVVQPLGADRLEQLVAPIALYPDTLLASVLTA